MNEKHRALSNWRSVLSDRTVGAALGLGFSTGMPFLLVYVTQSAWLSDAKVPIATLGLLSELTLASDEYAASQYALLTSLVALPGSLLAGASGFLIERLGFEWFFVTTAIIGAPVALLAWYVWRRDARMRTPVVA